MIIRDEALADQSAIRDIVAAAFLTMPYSHQTEHLIVDALRRAGAMTLSLVAEEDGAVVGHAAFSPATIDDRPGGWHALGPIAVRPDRQRRGIGSALLREGLARLRQRGAEGCLLVGNPAFYTRFGFRNDARLTVEGVPPQYLLVLPFGEDVPRGRVGFHPAFAATA